jgi:hypothetical protein
MKILDKIFYPNRKIKPLAMIIGLYLTIPAGAGMSSLMNYIADNIKIDTPIIKRADSIPSTILLGYDLNSDEIIDKIVESKQIGKYILNITYYPKDKNFGELNKRLK